MNPRFRVEGQFRLLIRFVLIAQFLSKNQLLPIANALNGVIWDKKSGDFVRIFSIKQFADINEHYSSLSHALETYNFNGTQLRLTAFPIKNLFEFPSKNDTRVKGAHGELWKLLSEMLNFKIRYIKSETNEFGNEQKNGSWDGLARYIYQNETDIIPRIPLSAKRLSTMEYVLPVWSTKYKLCVEKRLEYDLAWMTRLFSPSLWASVFGLFFALSITSFLFKVLSYGNGENPSGDFATLKDHFFHVYSIFCNQGWISPQLNRYNKLLTFSAGVSSWLIFVAFNSTLISHITQRRFREPFDSLENFYHDTNFKVLIKRNSLIRSLFHDRRNSTYTSIVNSKRLIEIDMEEIAFKKICTGKYTLLEAEDVVQAANTHQCEIICIGRKPVQTWIGSGVIRGFKYKRTITLGILKLHEVGIINRLKTSWLMENSEIQGSNLFESIRLVHLSLIFSMLCCAFILSLGILLIENIVYLNKRCKR